MVYGLLRPRAGSTRRLTRSGTKNVVVVDNRFGEVGGSFRYAAARIERTRPAAAADKAS
jgi:single-strand DNA-binding protein